MSSRDGASSQNAMSSRNTMTGTLVGTLSVAILVAGFTLVSPGLSGVGAVGLAVCGVILCAMILCSVPLALSIVGRRGVRAPGT